MHLKTGKNVLVGKSLQPAQVMANGYTVHFTRNHERDRAAEMLKQKRKVDPLLLDTIADAEHTGVTSSGFHPFTQGHKAGYVEVLVGGKHVQKVRASKLVDPAAKKGK